jgi:hypothetical protein
VRVAVLAAAILLAAPASAEQWARRLHTHSGGGGYAFRFEIVEGAPEAAAGQVAAMDDDVALQVLATGVVDSTAFDLPAASYSVGLCCRYLGTAIAAGDEFTLCLAETDASGTASTATTACLTIVNSADTVESLCTATDTTVTTAGTGLVLELESVVNGGGASNLQGSCVVTMDPQ